MRTRYVRQIKEVELEAVLVPSKMIKTYSGAARLMKTTHSTVVHSNKSRLHYFHAFAFALTFAFTFALQPSLRFFEVLSVLFVGAF
jgi:hypothetical protein